MKLKAFIYGMISSLMVWGLLILADFIDEKVLDTGTFLGILIFMIAPVVMINLYIVYNIKKNPSGKRIILWFVGYYLVFCPLWYIIGHAVNYNQFIVEQKNRGSYIDLNGIEYVFYGYGVLLIFTLVCLIFSLIRFIYKKIKLAGKSDLDRS